MAFTSTGVSERSETRRGGTTRIASKAGSFGQKGTGMKHNSISSQGGSVVSGPIGPPAKSRGSNKTRS